MSTAPVPALALYEADARSIDDIMRVMDEAFDPEFGEAWSRSQCLGILAQDGVWAAIACFEGIIAGFALARMIVDESELLLLGVRPRWRRHGIGRELVRAVRNGAHRRGAYRLHLEVREGNEADNLYRSEGFAPIGRRKAYYSGRRGARFDAITLALDIS